MPHTHAQPSPHCSRRAAARALRIRRSRARENGTYRRPRAWAAGVRRSPAAAGDTGSARSGWEGGRGGGSSTSTLPPPLPGNQAAGGGAGRRGLRRGGALGGGWKKAVVGGVMTLARGRRAEPRRCGTALPSGRGSRRVGGALVETGCGLCGMRPLPWSHRAETEGGDLWAEWVGPRGNPAGWMVGGASEGGA